MTDGLRLYLDTADLISIADGNRVSDATVQRLFEAIEATRATLVVSLWHVVDLRAAPPDVARRVIDAVGRFPLRGLIGPDAEGVRVLPLDSFADVVDEDPEAVHLVNILPMPIRTSRSQQSRYPPPSPSDSSISASDCYARCRPRRLRMKPCA